MKYYFLIFVSLIVIILSSCKDEELIIDRENLLIGNWEFEVSSERSDNTIYQLRHTEKFSEKYGSLFLGKDSLYQYRGSWGAAGLPTMFEGTWFSINDTLIQISLQFPVKEDYKLAVPFVNSKELRYYYIYN